MIVNCLTWSGGLLLVKGLTFCSNADQWNSCCRFTDQDLLLDNVKIPRGSLIYVSLYALHTSGRLWNKPEEFRPERWISHEIDNASLAPKHLLINGADDKILPYLPFSNGPRSCIAQVQKVFWIKFCFKCTTLLSLQLQEFVAKYCRELLFLHGTHVCWAGDGNDGASSGLSAFLLPLSIAANRKQPHYGRCGVFGKNGFDSADGGWHALTLHSTRAWNALV